MKQSSNTPLPIGTAAAVAGISRRLLDRAAQRGDLRCVIIPGRRGRHVLAGDLEAFLRPRPAVVNRAGSTHAA